ncbi:MAG: recombinase RecQ [Sphingobacteriales bacterium 17-39-43]|uniref:RecQ family ATP-dependent DNA helicase n=1 Tax=Daejeonella sp. TaxID=2805397 RepID=UPI000BCBA93F|nr:ATP-dependent DNA helicase RecQ [Daejeonella sp.]OYY00606.1 MAG: recombinase RecQ [Sphingobacteriia bacterium 35-40-5]OYZ32828.1 MAG: recombinase RecQ [Sphingobacteriales bacterium 16-39-50]OZA26238.1 MAG: recombinase RecQ [Sphingobacteriales bacterium 17-39-43]HQT23182.1 ATP-dependent DNA helicase RecQ [Daejeonella sp.]HQT56093.1 ATP-dependent DNA helicase RecQ [Daejeonella sp.]
MTIQSILSKYWGFSTFRPLQEDIIQSVLEGNDTLALMPTGGGKSLCFQVPALLKPGICIVVSPLIALMKDQVENLKEKGIKAIAIISGMGKREVDIALDNCIYGDIKFLYLSPERLLSDLVRERIRYMKVNLIAIDEAHCISQWGYDFRPPYLHLTELRELHPEIPVLALTATATERVAADIQVKLNFKNRLVFRKSFERLNLSYLVYNEENKLRKLISIARNVKGSGIIYVRNRRETQEVSRQLNLEGIISDFYHAGLDTPLRMKKQSAWKNSEIRIMVATNAFGMGIDKADVRFVVHLDLPESLEAYYQEAGRCGRDEKKAYAVLLYNNADKALITKRLDQHYPSIDEIKQIYHNLGNYYQLAYGAGEGLSLEFDLADFCNRFKLDPVRAIHAFKFLEHDEYLALSETVFLPSRVQVLLTHEDLYRFQVGQPAYDHFIKVLLRSYGGIFEQLVGIKESDLAKRVDISRTETVKILSKLHELQIITYIPLTDKPHLNFIKPRVDSQHLYIDRKYHADRYQIHKSQIEAVLAYAENYKCRSQQLLNYFNETHAKVCGVCDVCIENRKLNKKDSQNDEIIKEILNELSKSPSHLDQLMEAINTGNSNERLKVIRMLLDAGTIKVNGEFYYLKG